MNKLQEEKEDTTGLTKLVIGLILLILVGVGFVNTISTITGSPNTGNSLILLLSFIISLFLVWYSFIGIKKWFSKNKECSTQRKIYTTLTVLVYIIISIIGGN